MRLNYSYYYCCLFACTGCIVFEYTKLCKSSNRVKTPQNSECNLHGAVPDLAAFYSEIHTLTLYICVCVLRAEDPGDGGEEDRANGRVAENVCGGRPTDSAHHREMPGWNDTSGRVH